MANNIYRGASNVAPETINLPVAGAYLPGTWVDSDLSELTQITVAAGKRPLLLANRSFYDQDTATAYTSGETGVAYRVTPEMPVQCAMAAATYAYGAELTISTAGRLAAATSGDVVVAFFDQAGGAVTAGELADVVIANFYVKA